MAYTGLQRNLLAAAEKYANLGYRVGLSNGKELIGAYECAGNNLGDWDGISFHLAGLACVDIDCSPMPDLDVLPPTLKEKSPRGLHLFYRLPDNLILIDCLPKINWKKHVDLLVSSPSQKVKYGNKKSALVKDWGGHVLVSPTNGYVRVYPDITPNISKLALAPDWLIDALTT